MGNLFWHCANCGVHEPVEPTGESGVEYVLGDHEPCDCEGGTARVVADVPYVRSWRDDGDGGVRPVVALVLMREQASLVGPIMIAQDIEPSRPEPTMLPWDYLSGNGWKESKWKP